MINHFRANFSKQVNCAAVKLCDTVERIAIVKMDEVKKAVAAILTRPEYLLPTERNRITRKAAEELLQASTEEAELFKDFSDKLVDAVKGFCVGSFSGKSSEVEKSIRSFHLSRTRETGCDLE